MFKLSARLRQWLLIQSKETAAVRALFVLSLLIGVPQIFDLTAASALVVTLLSPEMLPWLVLGSGIGSGVLATLFFLLFRNRQAKQRIVGLAWFLLVGTTALAVYTVASPRNTTLAVLFYFWSRIENVFLAVMFLVAANARFTPRQSRRVLGFTATGQVITLIAGGAIIPLILRAIAPEHLVFVSLLAHALVVVHVSRFPAQSITFQSSEARDQRSLTGWLFLLIAAMYLVYFLVDTAFLGGIDSTTDPGFDSGTFFARFWLLVGVVALVVKLAVTGRVLHRFGLTVGLLLAPIGMLALFVVAPFAATLFGRTAFTVVVVLKAAERVLDGSIFLPSFYGMFQAFGPRIQNRNQLLAESLVGQGVASIAGFLLVIGPGRFSLQYIYALGGGLTVVWIAVGIVSARRYRRTTERALAPPDRRSWPSELPLPEATGGERRIEERAVADRIAARFALGRSLQQWRAESREMWEPLADAWHHEWQQNIDRIAELIDAEQGIARLSERVHRLRRLPEEAYHTAVEGLLTIVPARYREPFMILLEQDEPFLLDRSLRSLQTDEPTPDYSRWTQRMIDLSAHPEREQRWHNSHENLISLKRSELFGPFPLEYLHELTQGVALRAYGDGQAVVSQGEPGDSLYVITHGAVSILHEDQVIARLEAGSCFGELSTILPERRSATVAADGAVTTLVLERTEVTAFLYRHVSAIQMLESILFDRIANKIAGWPQRSARSIKARRVRVKPNDAWTLAKQLSVLIDLIGSERADFVINVDYFRLEERDLLSLPATAFDTLLLVVSGAVTEYAHQTQLATFPTGSVVGVLPWFGLNLEQHVIRAGEPSIVASISVDVYEAFLARSPAFHMGMLQSLVLVSRGLAHIREQRGSE